MKVVGQGLNRVDAYGKVTGEAKYSADLEPRDILHGKVIHSTIANGLVKSFDLTEALKVPGVVKILTCFDAPDCQFPTAGHPWSVEAKHQDICDRRVLNQRVRLYGDDIAAVVAENEVAAAQAARLVKVEYEEYEPIVTVKAAMAPGATPLHPDIRKDNVIVHSHMTMGPKDFTFEDGLKQAKEKNVDVLICDTAGRLQNKVNLMNELEKMNRIIKREVPDAPHETLLVIDATTGQNGVSQAVEFSKITDVSGLVLTKMDGTAKGGIVLSIKDQLNIPVKFIGLGESVDDLQEFDLDQYIYGLCKNLVEE